MQNYTSKITSFNSIYELLQFYLIPNSVSLDGTDLSELYWFLSKVTPWDLTRTEFGNTFEDNPPLFSSETVKNYKDLQKQIFAVKKITSSSIGFVIPRIDWKYGTNYFQYSDINELLNTKLSLKLTNIEGSTVLNSQTNRIYFNNFANGANADNGWLYESSYLTYALQPNQYISGPGIYTGTKITAIDLDPFEGQPYFQLSLSQKPAFTTYSSGPEINIETYYKDRKNFYIKNSFDQVFKCLSNNNSSISTTEPMIGFGAADTKTVVKTPDGYQWKYLYTIDQGQKYKFMDDVWMPVPPPETSPNSWGNSAKKGTIDTILVINGGYGFTESETANTVSVTITGDGQGASATATVIGDTITSINMINSGNNYTYASITIQDLAEPTNVDGVNAVSLTPSISPIGGHGTNLISELGARNAMVSLEINGDEGGKIPDNISYYQLGLMLNPYSKSTYPAYANNEVYSTTVDVVVSSGIGQYYSGETVYQGVSLEESNFTATVVNFNQTTNVLKLINIDGTIVIGDLLKGTSSSVIRVIIDKSEPDFMTDSGYILYVENRKEINRSFDGTEQLKMVFEY